MFEDDLIVINSNGKFGKPRHWWDQAIDNAKRQIMEQEDVEILKILNSLDNEEKL